MVDLVTQGAEIIKKNMQVKAIIFDCFGVLYVDTTKAYFAEFPDKRTDLQAINVACDRGLMSREDYYEAVSTITGQPRAAVDIAFKREHTLNQAALTYIAHSLKPSYKIGLLSNIGRDWIQDFFDEYQLHELFDVTVFSSSEGILKPDVEIFRRTAERLKVLPEECIMIDDTLANCDGARLAGMQAVLYQDFETMKQVLQRLLQQNVH